MTTACPRAPCGKKKQHTDPHGEDKKKNGKYGMTVTGFG